MAVVLQGVAVRPTPVERLRRPTHERRVAQPASMRQVRRPRSSPRDVTMLIAGLLLLLAGGLRRRPTLPSPSAIAARLPTLSGRLPGMCRQASDHKEPLVL